MKLQQGESQKTWRRLARTFWRDERGQSTTEYILILSVVVMIAMKFKKMFNDSMTSAVTKLGGEINNALDDSSQ